MKSTKLVICCVVFFISLLPATAQTKSDIMGFWEISKVRVIDDKNKNNQADEGLSVSDIDDTSKSAIIREFGIYENDFFISRGENGEKGQDVIVNNGKIAFQLIDDTSLEVGCKLLKENKMQLIYEVKLVVDNVIVSRKYSCIYTRR